jgi:hypothetical protein
MRKRPESPELSELKLMPKLEALSDAVAGSTVLPFVLAVHAWAEICAPAAMEP